MTAHDIIIAPVITEKSNMDMAEGKYTFRVAKNASKTEVKKAVEELIDTGVLQAVETMGKNMSLINENVKMQEQ